MKYLFAAFVFFLSFGPIAAKADYLVVLHCAWDMKKVTVMGLSAPRVNPLLLALKMKKEAGCEPKLALKEFATMNGCKKKMSAFVPDLFRRLLAQKRWSMNYVWCLEDPKSIRVNF